VVPLHTIVNHKATRRIHFKASPGLPRLQLKESDANASTLESRYVCVDVCSTGGRIHDAKHSGTDVAM
jgi:hypothetical protein